MKIYIASAMFTEEQQSRINKTARILRAMGHEVFVPHEYKVPNADKLENKGAHWKNLEMRAEGERKMQVVTNQISVLISKEE